MGAERAELFSTAQLLLVELRAPSTGLGAGYFREDKGREQGKVTDNSIWEVFVCIFVKPILLSTLFVFMEPPAPSKHLTQTQEPPAAPRSSLILPQRPPGVLALPPGEGSGAPRGPPPNPKPDTRGPLPRTLIVLSMSCSPDILPRGPAGGTGHQRVPEGLARPRAAPAELRSASSPAGRAGGRQRLREAAGGPSAAAQPRSRRPGARHRRHLGRAAPPGGAEPR